MSGTEVAGLIERACPICGACASRPGIASRPTAEVLGWSDLEASWRGLFKHKSFLTYGRCTVCGTLYAQRYFSPDQLGRLYGAMEANMNEVGADLLARTQQGYFNLVAPHLRTGGDYLELGPDVGHFTALAAASGRYGRYWLIEPNRLVWPALARIGGNDVRLFERTEGLEQIGEASVAFAAAIHVLDHITDPVEILRRIRARLVPGGCLMSVTHDERSALARILGPRWPAFCLQHPQLYNCHSIRALFEAAGFEVMFVRKSANFFPLGFLLRQGVFAATRHDPRFLQWFDRVVLGLKLGNILTLARAPGGAA